MWHNVGMIISHGYIKVIYRKLYHKALTALTFIREESLFYNDNIIYIEKLLLLFSIMTWLYFDITGSQNLLPDKFITETNPPVSRWVILPANRQILHENIFLTVFCHNVSISWTDKFEVFTNDFTITNMHVANVSCSITDCWP